MKYSIKHSSKHNPIRRTAALLCAAMLGLSLASARTFAQVTGPLPTSPPTPTPFQAPVFHSGGGPGATYPTDTASAPFLDPLLNPLQGQLQGTPTELYSPTAGGPYVFTQIPSFLLGNYDPTRPPTGLISDGAGGLINVYYPNHFADGSIYTWAAPFVYTLISDTAVTVDDSAAAPVFTGGVATTSGFTASSGFASITDPNAAAPGPVTSPAAGTATNDEYLRLPSGTPGSAIWTLVQPTAGNYSLYFHIPEDLPDSNNKPEIRDTQVVYAVSVRDAGGNVTLTTTGTASQQEANDTQFLAGPFQLVAGGSVVVTLLRTTNDPKVNDNNDVLVADSMTLQPTVGDVESAPTAITRNRFPAEFGSTTHPLQYWGIFVPPGSTLAAPAPTATTAGTQAVANGNPDTTLGAVNPTGSTTSASFNGGNILLRSGKQASLTDPTHAGAVGTDGVTPDPIRIIRQLVYFGRSDPSASVSNSVDDSAPAPAGNPPSGFSGSGTQVADPTASNGGYRISTQSAGAVTIATPAVATWDVPVPNAGAGTGSFVYAHIPATPNGQVRSNHAVYTVTADGVTYGPVFISQQTQGTDALVVLPVGAVQAAAGSSIVVRMYGVNNLTTAPATNTVVVADSVTVSTGTGQGAIYCVDGFNGAVVWRYETPGSAAGSSAPVFSSPAVTRINVMVTPPVYSASGAITTPAVYANRLVVIVGDNNGLVYCLDAIGNGDGTSNVNALAKDANGVPIPGQPITIPQPAYAGTYGADTTLGTPSAPLVAGTPAAAAALTAHVGTTGTYWVYRPDPNRPKYVTGTNIGKVKPLDPTTDLPVPAAFGTASPNVFVDPTVSTTPDATNQLKSNAVVYIGNTNGVLYALNALGVALNGTTPDSVTGPGNATSALAFAATGDTFNVSQDLQTGLVTRVPTPQPLWWFSVRGVDPNGATNTSSADIESAPAIHVTTTGTGATTVYTPTVYIGSAHEQETTSNVGRLYALNGLYGPSGNNGRSSPVTQPAPTAANYTGPGSFNYNVGQIPQISKTDTADWSFPDGVGATAYAVGKSSSGKPRPALGNITGSPVVFTNTDDNVGIQTRLYFAANSGKEYPATERPDETQTGRVWAVNLDGSVGTTLKSGTTGSVWAYPLANDPNNATLDTTAEPVPPIGAFLRGTPAIGFVQFPNVTTNGDGTTYPHADATGASVNGRAVPMLYIGTRGVNDTALYAVDIDGDETPTTDQRTIYREASPNGSIYQSSPALVTNATINNTGTNGTNNGNGGAVYAVAGNTMYDYSATPISNPFPGQAYPLIRLDRTFVGIGPISSPTLAGADVSDFSSAQTFLASGTATPGLTNTGAFSTLDTDWIYVGDSSSGYCRGITPFDTSYGGIPIELNQIIPYDPEPVQTPPLDTFIQTFLVQNQPSVSSHDALPIGLNAPLPVYEWGQSAFIRFSNAVPPNPAKDPTLFVYDTRKYAAADLTAATSSAPVPFYTSDGTTNETITFDLSDVDVTSGVPLVQQGSQQVQPRLITTPPDGFVLDAASGPPTNFPSFFADVVTNLATTTGKHFLGTYTYAVGDVGPLGSAPGARRRILNAKQTVDEYDYQGDLHGNGVDNFDNYKFIRKVLSGTGDATPENLVTQIDPTTHQPTFNSKSRVAAVDQPVFGILNPLGARGGGLNLLSASTAAVPIGDSVNFNGDTVGPFRSVSSPPTLSTPTDPKTGVPTSTTTTTTPGDNFALQALANGNNIPTVAPPSSSGVTGDPTKLQNGVNDPTGVSTPTTTAVVVTATGLIPHNTVSDNEEISVPGTLVNGLVIGQNSGTSTNGLQATGFGGYGLNIFDRSALFSIGQPLRVKMTVPALSPNNVPLTRDGLFWNSNAPLNGFGTTGHDSVVNFLPWETAPTPYVAGVNTSLEYPDITPGNIAQNIAQVTNSDKVANNAGDLTSNSVTLTPATGSAQAVSSRTMYGDPVQIKITVPNHQPANQQLYQQPAGGTTKYTGAGEIAPVNANGTNQINLPQAFPMGYITLKRVFVPSPSGSFNTQRPYRDVHIYTGVPIDMRTSIATTTTDIGQVPAAFGVQTETDPALGYFTPYNPNFASGNLIQSYFKPLEVRNDGNVNLLNAHFDQKAQPTPGIGVPVTTAITQTVHLYSDTASLLSILDGYDVYGTTGPRTGAVNNVPEQPYLIRTSLDSDLFRAYGQNPYFNGNAAYPGATFHKPAVGTDQPSLLTVPDAPESYVPGASLSSQPAPTLPTITDPSNFNLPYKSAPFVSIAFPFGTPVGTYTMSPAGALRLFEGLDTAAVSAYSLSPSVYGIPSYLYPPKYGGAVGGIGGYLPTGPAAPSVDTADAGQPVDKNGDDEDIYNGLQPLSTTGTLLSGHVIEQRLTDGFTYGALPMIDGGQAGPAVGASLATSTPDFAPAAFRDLATGDLSVYWTSGRGTGYGIYGANVMFQPFPTGNTNGYGYFVPSNPAPKWWNPFTPSLATGTNSGLSVTTTLTGTDYAFTVNVAPGTTYNNTLYAYPITNPKDGLLSQGVPVTPASDGSQVKYGVKGVYASNFTNKLWAFWTASTRGRTALYYSPQSAWNTTPTLLPVPAGLTAVSDASPLIITAPVPSASGAPTYQDVAEVTYSGIGPDGNADLYVSRYLPDTKTPTQLDQVPYQPVTENLTATTTGSVKTGWFQARDVAWSRTGALNISVAVKGINGIVTQMPLLYDATGKPLFKNAIYDKASGFLVLTGVTVPYAATPASGQSSTTSTVYVDAATGRIRFSPALITATQTFPTIQATFSPLARRLTTDSRADVAPVTFLDTAQKPNDAASIPNSLYTGPVNASRRWTIWRKTGIAGQGSTATLYFKTQRLTLFLPTPQPATTIDPTKTVTVILTASGTAVTGFDLDALRNRLYFPMGPNVTNVEGQQVTVTYTDSAGTSHTGTTAVTDTVQWQDEAPANALPASGDLVPTNTIAGLDTVFDTLVPIQTATNENNVTAFLDPYAGLLSANGVTLNPHKVWLFWNSTRNGTADIYSETIDPRFAPAPAIP